MTLQEYKKQKMQNPDFSAAYDEIQPEMDIIRAIIDARTRLRSAVWKMEVEIHPSNCFSALPKEWE